MKVNFCWYTYDKDSPIINYSVGSVLKHFPGSKCFIYEDGLKPISEPYRQKLLNKGKSVRIRKTWFLRKGNLNGIECIRGILGGMQEASKDVDWVAKIDTDNILFRKDYIVNLVQKHSDKQQVGFAKKNADFCWGWLYFLKKDIIVKLLLELSRAGRMFYDPSGVFAEDSTLSALVRHTAQQDAIYVISSKSIMITYSFGITILR